MCKKTKKKFFFLTNVHWDLLTLYHFWHAFAAAIFLAIVIVASACIAIRVISIFIVKCATLMMIVMVNVTIFTCMQQLHIGLEKSHWAFALFLLDKIIIHVNGEFIVVGWHNVISIVVSLNIFINWLAKQQFWCVSEIGIWCWCYFRFIRRYVNAWFRRYKDYGVDRDRDTQL